MAPGLPALSWIVVPVHNVVSLPRLTEGVMITCTVMESLLVPHILDDWAQYIPPADTVMLGLITPVLHRAGRPFWVAVKVNEVPLQMVVSFPNKTTGAARVATVIESVADPHTLPAVTQ